MFFKTKIVTPIYNINNTDVLFTIRITVILTQQKTPKKKDQHKVQKIKKINCESN